MHFCCRAPYGARGLKSPGIYARRQGRARRAPYGARGLKYVKRAISRETAESRPVWGAWIEIIGYLPTVLLAFGRAPYGARGLKLNPMLPEKSLLKSRPVWGAWIEINSPGFRLYQGSKSRPVWGAWIEISSWRLS